MLFRSSFNIDANGIVNVSAKDKASGKEQKITITGGGSLSEDEIKKMQEDAEKHADEDKKKKEMVEAKNQADTLIYTAEKTLSDAGDKVSDEDKKPVTEAVAALKEKKDTEDVEELKKLTEDLNNKLMKIGEKMYQDQGTAEPKEGEAKSEDAEEKKSDEAEEGEIVDDKKEEK